MRRVDLEVAVQRAVEDMRAGRMREDDRIEVKSDWPDTSKARQLAGAANALRGEPLIYIIGCREDGSLSVPSPQDAESWHSAMRAAFDSPPPNLALHATVAVGDQPGESVVALLFDTDQFPYVMSVRGQDRREVPIRVATGTESANRTQLLRILAPSVTSPRCEILDAEVRASVVDYASYGGTPLVPARQARTELSMSLQFSAFIEYVGGSAATIPEHSIRARISVPGREPWVCRPEVWRPFLGPGVAPRPAPRFGVHVGDGFVVATGPGMFSAQASWSMSTDAVARDELDETVACLAECAEVALEVRFSFVSVERPTTLRAAVPVEESQRTTAPDKWSRKWVAGVNSEAVDW